MAPHVKEQEVQYPLGHTDEERQRLIDQDKLFRPTTEKLFRMAGIKPGMRVLDVGSGVGDVSIMAADFVGPEGSVIGVDTDARSLALARQRVAEQGFENVSFAEGQLEATHFDKPFDAVVGRFVLVYLPDPVVALRHLAGMLVPGGRMAFQEYVLKYDGFACPERVTQWDQAYGYVVRGLEAAGLELEMGLKLSQFFTVAGLPLPHMHMDVHLLSSSDNSLIKVGVDLLRSLVPVLKQFEIASEEQLNLENLEGALHAEFSGKNAVTSWPPVVSAWTRLPTGE